MPQEHEDVRYERIDGVLYKISHESSGGMMYEYRERVEEADEGKEEAAPGVSFQDVVFGGREGSAERGRGPHVAEPADRLNERVAEQADRLASVLLAEDAGAHQSPERRTHIYTGDVETDAARFNAQLDFCHSAKVPYPCVQAGRAEPVPIDFTFGGVFPQTDPDFSRDILPRLHDLAINNREMFVGKNARLEGYAPDDAKSFFKNRLINFFISRFTNPPPTARPSGFKFRVLTSARGLRVHYSQSYFRNPALVFGSPTSPVEDYIKGGRWVFGVMGKGMKGPIFSESEFEVPEKTEADLSAEM